MKTSLEVQNNKAGNYNKGNVDGINPGNKVGTSLKNKAAFENFSADMMMNQDALSTQSMGSQTKEG